MQTQQIIAFLCGINKTFKITVLNLNIVLIKSQLFISVSFQITSASPFSFLWKFTQNQKITAFFVLVLNCVFNANFPRKWSKTIGLSDANSDL